MARIVIGITGPIGSGVSTTADAFALNGFRKLKISDAIRREYAKQNPGTPLSFDHDGRKTLQDIGNQFRKDNPSYWITRVLTDSGVIDTSGKVIDTTTDIVIESIRNPHEAKTLLNLFAPHFFLIALQASKEERWRRVKTVYQGKEFDFERDDDRDTEEDIPHGQQVDACVQLADYALVNEIDKGANETQRLSLWRELQSDVLLMRSAHDYDGVSGIRAASPTEVAMAVAYAQSYQSACIKRLVGAVIVAENGIPLSTGFNENPFPMLSCQSEYGYCYKDSEMHRRLDALTNVFCPGCGEKIPKLEKPYACPKCHNNLKDRFLPSRNIEICTAIHAEERAIRSLGGRSAKDATLFCTTFPCFQCSRYIVDAGITKVVYVEAYPIKQSLTFLKKNGVAVEPFNGFKARSFNLIFKQVR